MSDAVTDRALRQSILQQAKAIRTISDLLGWCEDQESVVEQRILADRANATNGDRIIHKIGREADQLARAYCPPRLVGTLPDVPVYEPHFYDRPKALTVLHAVADWCRSQQRYQILQGMVSLGENGFRMKGQVATGQELGNRDRISSLLMRGVIQLVPEESLIATPGRREDVVEALSETPESTAETGDQEFMTLAIEEARKSSNEDERAHPKVGAVVVKDGKVLAVAHRGELEQGDHAEYTALEKKLRDETLAGATVYTTLEPCTTRNHPKIPCATRIVERKFRRVVIGMLDPNPNISGKGVQLLRDHNIAVSLFPEDLMAILEELNRDFTRTHSLPASTLPGKSQMMAATAIKARSESGPFEKDREMTADAFRHELQSLQADFRRLREAGSDAHNLRLDWIQGIDGKCRDFNVRQYLTSAVRDKFVSLSRRVGVLFQPYRDNLGLSDRDMSDTETVWYHILVKHAPRFDSNPAYISKENGTDELAFMMCSLHDVLSICDTAIDNILARTWSLKSEPETQNRQDAARTSPTENTEGYVDTGAAFRSSRIPDSCSSVGAASGRLSWSPKTGPPIKL